VALQIQGVRVSLQSVGKPAKPRSQAILVSTVEGRNILIEVLWCQCRPYTEAEILFWRTDKR
jgi:hypothetical protein